MTSVIQRSRTALNGLVFPTLSFLTILHYEQFLSCKGDVAPLPFMPVITGAEQRMERYAFDYCCVNGLLSYIATSFAAV